MSKPVTDFLIELSKDPLLAEQFRNDRVRAIAEAGFAGREAEILTSSDPTAVRSYFPEMWASATQTGPGKKPKKPKTSKGKTSKKK